MIRMLPETAAFLTLPNMQTRIAVNVHLGVCCAWDKKI